MMIGRRLQIRWTGDRGKPWYGGKIVEWWPINEHHLIKYDDGELKAHNLKEEEACGQLRWLDADRAAAGPVAKKPRVEAVRKSQQVKPPPQNTTKNTSKAQQQREPSRQKPKSKAPIPPQPSLAAKLSPGKPSRPAPSPPFGSDVVGHRLSVHWLDEDPDAEGNTPWYCGKVVEFRPFSQPPTHLVRYDDNEQVEEDLAALLADGCLRWLGDDDEVLEAACRWLAAAVAVATTAALARTPSRA